MKLGLFAIGFIAIPSLARLQLIPETFTSNEKWSVPNLHTCVPRRYWFVEFYGQNALEFLGLIFLSGLINVQIMTNGPFNKIRSSNSKGEPLGRDL